MGIRTSKQNVAYGVGLIGLAALAIYWNPVNPVAAQAPAAQEKPAAPEPSPDYSRRVVAYIFNTIPITREELGEYLIARQGVDRLTNLVNKRIIEHVARQKGIDITAAEVEAALEQDLKGLNVNRKEFVSHVLKKYGKTLYEWKEDVTKPRLIMTAICRDRVKVTEEDVKMAYDAHYGEKIDARIILWPQGEKHIAMKMYGEIRRSDEGFDKAAREQASAELAGSGGRITPFGRNTTGNPELERAAFSLKPGEITQIIETPEGFVVLKCVGRVSADTSKKLEDVRAALEKEVFDKKVQLEIPKVFKEMHEQAQAVQLLKPYTTEEQLLRNVRKEVPGLSSPAAQKGN